MARLTRVGLIGAAQVPGTLAGPVGHSRTQRDAVITLG